MFTSLILALAVGAPAPKAEAKKDPPTVVGKWVPESAMVGGRPDNPPPGTMFEFTADGQFLMTADGKPRPETSAYTVDPKKDPAEIDLVSPKGEKILGIYKFDKDGKLTLTFVKGKNEARPKKFDDKEAVMMVLEKTKE